MELYFTDYRISTITSNAKLFIKDVEDFKINLIELFNNITINCDDLCESFVYTSRLENKDSINR